MKTRDFLKQVWPDQGHYCIAVPYITSTGDKSYKHAIWDTLDDAYLDSRSRYQQTDIYFGIFTHINARVLKLKYNKMLPSRKKENMDQAKCLFLDLDVGKSEGKIHKYATQADALSALAKFIFRTGLPQPIVVSSGNGLHVYWPLTDAVKADDWKPHAANLRLLLDENKVLYDPSRTTDTTSVLRMPATLNHKNPADLKKVEVLFEGDGESDNTALFSLIAQLTNNLQPTRVMTPANVGGFSNIVVGTNFPPTDPDEVANECEQVRALRDQNGNIPEPLWYAIAGVLAYCTDGEQAFHNWSSGHPNYTEAEAQNKLEQWKANGSVTSCAKLNADGIQGACARCPHFGGQFKNPVVIVNKKPVVQAFVQAAPAVTNTCPPPVCDPPKPYSRTNGFSVTRWDDVKGLTVNVLFEFDLYPISVSSGLVGGSKVNGGLSTWIAREHTATKAMRWHQFEVPGDLLSDAKELTRHFNGHGLFVPVTTDVAKYMSAYLRELKAQTGLKAQHTHVGWPDKDQIDRFILNGKIIDEKGISSPCVMSRTTEIITDGMTQGGTLLGQIAALDYFNRPGYEAQQFFILSSLAAPLFMATGHHGLVINASGDSAAGKTTALKAGAGFWGNPAKLIVNGTANGITPLAREARAMVLMNLPNFVDEITHMDPEDARAMVMSSTQSKLRDSLKSDRTPREPKLPGHRATPMLSTGNSSLHQVVNTGNNQAGTANSARVVETPFLKTKHTHTKTEADALGRELDAHYGWLGEQFLSQAMPTMGLLFESVRRMMTKIDRATGAQGIERFIVAAGAPVFVAGTFAVYQGLLHWDMTRLFDWYVQELFVHMRDQLREQGETVSSDNILREFIAAHSLDMVVVDKTGNITNPIHLRNQIAINYRVDIDEMWVSKHVFTDWCRKRGTTVSSMLDELYRAGCVTCVDTRKNMGDGSNFKTGLNRAFTVNTKHPMIGM